MYECHLWIVLRESAEEYDEGGLRPKLESLRRVVTRQLPDAHPPQPVLGINVSTVFQCSLERNHLNDTHERMLSVLDWIVAELPGSYGLVYWNDDEANGSSDSFQVIVVARGK